MTLDEQVLFFYADMFLGSGAGVSYSFGRGLNRSYYSILSIQLIPSDSCD